VLRRVKASIEVRNHAAEIALRGERKLGEIIAGWKKIKADDPRKLVPKGNRFPKSSPLPLPILAFPKRFPAGRGFWPMLVEFVTTRHRAGVGLGGAGPGLALRPGS
jgi:hypothetical protein